jgi:hypothetical protein
MSFNWNQPPQEGLQFVSQPGGMPPPQQQPMPGMRPGMQPGAQALRPEDIKMLLDTQGMKPERERIAHQRELADMMRKSSMSNSGMEGQMTGRIYTPPSWLNGLAKVGQAYMGGKMGADADAASGRLGQQDSAASRLFFNRLFGSKEGTPVVPADYGG